MEHREEAEGPPVPIYSYVHVGHGGVAGHAHEGTATVSVIPEGGQQHFYQANHGNFLSPPEGPQPGAQMGYPRRRRCGAPRCKEEYQKELRPRYDDAITIRHLTHTQGLRASYRNRRPTDISWLSLFLVGMTIASFALWTALHHGNVNRLRHGVNANGGICGGDVGLFDLPLLYYPLDPAAAASRKLLPDARKCVAQCPTVDDVGRRAVIPITKGQVDRSRSGEGASFLEYTVNSPVYASVPLGRRLCVPIDPDLQAQVLRLSRRSFLYWWRDVHGSLLIAWPVTFSGLIIAYLLSVAHLHVVKQSPQIATKGAMLIMTVVSVFFLSLLARACIYQSTLSLSVDTAPEFPPVGISQYALEISSYVLAFVTLILLLCYLFYVHAGIHEGVTVVGRVLQKMGDVLFSMPSSEGYHGPSLLSAALLSGSLFWTLIYLMLAGTSGNDTTAEALLSNLNGSASILPFERTDYLPGWVFTLMIIWVAAGWWLHECALALNKFSAAYTAAVAYYGSTHDVSSDDEASPSAIALLIGVNNHLGSLALSAFWFAATRRKRMCRTLMYPPYLLADPDDMMEDLKARGPVSPGVFVEMAIASHDVRAAAREGSQLWREKDYADVSRLSGAVALGSCLTVACISLCSGCWTFYLLTRFRCFAWPLAKHYVPSPMAATIFTMALSASIAAIQVDWWSVFADSLLYCHLVEGREIALGARERPSPPAQPEGILAAEAMEELLDEECHYWCT